MKQILIVARGNKVNVHKFDNVTDAYHFYINEYSTFGEWWYYLRVAHTRLRSVTDEGIMKCVFRNCFDAVLMDDRG